MVCRCGMAQDGANWLKLAKMLGTNKLSKTNSAVVLPLISLRLLDSKYAIPSNKKIPINPTKFIFDFFLGIENNFYNEPHIYPVHQLQSDFFQMMFFGYKMQDCCR